MLGQESLLHRGTVVTLGQFRSLSDHLMTGIKPADMWGRQVRDHALQLSHMSHLQCSLRFSISNDSSECCVPGCDVTSSYVTCILHSLQQTTIHCIIEVFVVETRCLVLIRRLFLSQHGEILQLFFDTLLLSSDLGSGVTYVDITPSLVL